jgi:phosphate-selective porin
MRSNVVAVPILFLLAIPSTAKAQVPEEHPPVSETVAASAPPAAPAEEASVADASPLAKDGHPLAGWHNGLFYLRDYNDNFRLYVQGRAQIDTYTYFGPGVAETTLKPTIFLRRIRPELTGEFLGKWQWMLAGDFGATGLDNVRGTNETSAAAPGAAPTATTGRFAAAQTSRVSAAPTDVFVNYKADSLFNVQLGQYDAPFTMENRTSDKFIPFMERSLAVRAVGIPTNKELGLMTWGEMSNKLFFYSVGLFNGDGQNKLNTDSHGDVFGRVFVHPLATSQKGPLKDLQIGGSIHYGSRDRKYSYYDYPGLSTQGNYTFWSPVYNGAGGQTHVLPSGDQLGVAGELRIPVSIVDVTGELVYINNQTREAIEGFQATNTERAGSIHGTSYYAQLGIWAMGKRDINGVPGYENPSHLDFKKPDPAPARALQLLVKWEQVRLNYASAGRDGVADAKNIDGDIKVDAFSFGANLWFTKHVRLSANYVVNMFPDSAPTKATSAGGPVQGSSQRAIAPGNTLAAGVNDNARDNAHVLHELLFRVAIAM